jgi:hypothetical protein
MNTNTLSPGCNVIMDEIAEIKSMLGGKVLTEGEDYADARKVWNSIIDKWPAVIVHCGNAQVRHN